MGPWAFDRWDSPTGYFPRCSAEAVVYGQYTKSPIMFCKNWNWPWLTSDSQIAFSVCLFVALAGWGLQTFYYYWLVLIRQFANMQIPDYMFGKPRYHYASVPREEAITHAGSYGLIPENAYEGASALVAMILSASISQRGLMLPAPAFRSKFTGFFLSDHSWRMKWHY